MDRRYDIDALRVLAFALLILYHCGMLYVAEWEWVLKSSHLQHWLQWPMVFVNRWRMPLLFLISGLASAWLLAKDGGVGFVGGRTLRLLLPLLFGMAIVVPVQPYAQGVARGLVEPGFGAFLLHYWSFRPWPEGAFDGADYGVTWNHLWYLAYVFVYSLVLAALVGLSRRFGVRMAAPNLRGAALLVAPALPLIVLSITLRDRFETTHDLINDWYMHTVYFTVFVYGYLLAFARDIWDEILRLRGWALGAGLVCFAAMVLLDESLSDEPGTALIRLYRVLAWLDTVLWLTAILGYARRYLNRPFPGLDYARQAVLPWYVLHQSLTVWIAYLLVPRQIGVVPESILVIGGTVAGCALIYECLIRRSRWLSLMFGCQRRAPSSPDPHRESSAGVPDRQPS